MRFREMEIFHAVMQHGSVSAGAKALGLSQPSASKLLRQAEKGLGYELFERVRGRLHPTEEARLLFEEVKRAHQALEAVHTLGRRLGGAYHGHVRVAAPPAMALELIPEAVARFAAQHPGASIEVSSQHSGDILGANPRLATRFDLGFTFGAEAAPGLNVVELGRAPVLVALSPHLAPQHAPAVAFADLARLPFIRPDESEPLGRLVLERARAAGVELGHHLRAHAHHVALALAARGLGVALVDGFTARFHAEKARALAWRSCRSIRPPGSPSPPYTTPRRACRSRPAASRSRCARRSRRFLVTPQHSPRIVPFTHGMLFPNR